MSLRIREQLLNGDGTPLVRSLPSREHAGVSTSRALARRLALCTLASIAIAVLAVRLAMGPHEVVSSSCPYPGTACTTVTLGFPLADAWLVVFAGVGSLVGLLALGVTHDSRGPAAGDSASS